MKNVPHPGQLRVKSARHPTPRFIGRSLRNATPRPPQLITTEKKRKKKEATKREKRSTLQRVGTRPVSRYATPPGGGGRRQWDALAGRASARISQRLIIAAHPTLYNSSVKTYTYNIKNNYLYAVHRVGGALTAAQDGDRFQMTPAARCHRATVSTHNGCLTFDLA